jgi:hypothetical protein
MIGLVHDPRLLRATQAVKITVLFYCASIFFAKWQVVVLSWPEQFTPMRDIVGYFYHCSSESTRNKTASTGDDNYYIYRYTPLCGEFFNQQRSNG